MTTKMNPWIKSRWLGALRSGDFAQTTGTLQRIVADDNTTVGYCCLGVLCELAVADGVIEKEESEFSASFDGQEGVLPDAVVEWAGLSAQDPTVTDPDGNPNGLAHCNDSLGLTFDTIADLIEASL